jgi:hypothetical protein
MSCRSKFSAEDVSLKMVNQNSPTLNAHASIIQIHHEIRMQNEIMAIPVVTVKVGGVFLQF